MIYSFSTCERFVIERGWTYFHWLWYFIFFAWYYYIGSKFPSALIHIFTKLVRRSLTSRLGGVDPFKIEPIKFVKSCTLPCTIVAARKDDYIKTHHAFRVAQVYFCQYRPLATTFCWFFFLSLLLPWHLGLGIFESMWGSTFWAR